MQGENYNYIFQELIRLSLKRAVLICGGTEIDEDTISTKLSDPNIKEAVRGYDEKIKSFVTGLPLDEIRNVLVIKYIGTDYLYCVYPDEYYKTNSPAKIYRKMQKSKRFRDRDMYYENIKERCCNHIMQSYTLHDELVTGLKILRFI